MPQSACAGTNATRVLEGCPAVLKLRVLQGCLRFGVWRVAGPTGAAGGAVRHRFELHQVYADKAARAHQEAQGHHRRWADFDGVLKCKLAEGEALSMGRELERAVEDTVWATRGFSGVPASRSRSSSCS